MVCGGDHRRRGSYAAPSRLADGRRIGVSALKERNLEYFLAWMVEKGVNMYIGHVRAAVTAMEL